MEAAANPLASDDTTPPVTKMYFADTLATSLNCGMGLCPVRTSKYTARVVERIQVSSAYSGRMAALAQPASFTSLVKRALASVPLREGTSLHSVEWRNNSHGEPSIFVTYRTFPCGRTDEEEAGVLLRLVDDTLSAADKLDLPFFVYVEFQPA